ncbi:MAG: quercetin 2,3-dioxygenase, partial [Chloroflexales bacterium]|nr:quercetin 2,3-dioxygenase [Chloroflexales bacterium]
LGTLVTVKATQAQTGGAFGLIEQLLPPGFAPPLHVHHGEDEAFYVLEGEITFTCGEEHFVAQAGSFVFLPRDIPHTFLVSEERPARLLQLTAPAGFEQFHVDMGEPATNRTLPPPTAPDMARLLALAPSYQFEVVGPPPNREG